MRRFALVLLASSLASPVLAQAVATPSGGLSGNTGTSTNPLVIAPQNGLLPTNPDQIASSAGKGWSVATGLISVPANQQLDAVLSNPTGSGCTAVFTLRRYANTSTTVLQFQSFTNPTAITTNVSNIGNRLVGSTPNTGMAFGYAARAAGAMGGTGGVASALYAASDEQITLPLVLPPGKSYGVSLTGQGGGVLTAAVTLGVTFVGYCM